MPHSCGNVGTGRPPGWENRRYRDPSPGSRQARGVGHLGLGNAPCTSVGFFSGIPETFSFSCALVCPFGSVKMRDGEGGKDLERTEVDSGGLPGEGGQLSVPIPGLLWSGLRLEKFGSSMGSAGEMGS